MWQMNGYERQLGLLLVEEENVTYCKVAHRGRVMDQAK